MRANVVCHHNLKAKLAPDTSVPSVTKQEYRLANEEFLSPKFLLLGFCVFVLFLFNLVDFHNILFNTLSNSE